ncbi:hypothetical protein JCGZ_18667 [Jatropha curcas]|uniref:RING-type E3 ubiquitin transferase n=1 Tax=Jatropha curcas TaxID=180498 RepID=A0A067K0V4_JATCU|nr:RING-H2 finger protein ATL54 [Jatropha curcas]KDP29732.1 hypothetical protein JCGZ_18667 [Jatropha curcas]
MKDPNIEVSQNKDGICVFQCKAFLNPTRSCIGDCFKLCPNICKTLLVGNPFPPFFTSPPSPPLPPPSELPIFPQPSTESQNINQKHLLITSIMILGGLISAALLVCILCVILRVARRNSRRSRNAPLFFGTQEDFLDDYQDAETDNPIWYINTIGLQQSIIDSIAVFKYKKDEGLIDGTDCSVCLNEFEEDENLRLLPKCSHAFHISCIDTWLRSHKNCPLCRAPIVCDNFNVQIDLSMPTSTDFGIRGETHLDNIENNQVEEEEGTSEVRSGGDDMNCALPIEDEANNSALNSNCSRVQSDLVEGRQTVEVEMQPTRRSMSMDDSSAVEIYKEVDKYLKSKNVISKNGSNGSLRFGRMMKSFSIGDALQKRPISMKRSFSSSGKSSSSRHSRSHESVLPL